MAGKRSIRNKHSDSDGAPEPTKGSNGPASGERRIPSYHELHNLADGSIASQGNEQGVQPDGSPKAQGRKIPMYHELTNRIEDMYSTQHEGNALQEQTSQQPEEKQTGVVSEAEKTGRLEILSIPEDMPEKKEDPQQQVLLGDKKESLAALIEEKPAEVVQPKLELETHPTPEPQIEPAIKPDTGAKIESSISSNPDPSPVPKTQLESDAKSDVEIQAKSSAGKTPAPSTEVGSGSSSKLSTESSANPALDFEQKQEPKPAKLSPREAQVKDEAGVTKKFTKPSFSKTLHTEAPKSKKKPQNDTQKEQYKIIAQSPEGTIRVKKPLSH